MNRRDLISLPLAVSLALVLAPRVFGHGPASVVVNPSTVTAGENATLSVAGVEPNQDRVIILIGQGIVVTFPTVKTDASGGFTTEVTIPSRLPGGTYRFEAIGDETLTGDVDVMAAAGGIAAQAPAAQNAPEVRSRSGIEIVAIVGFALLAGLLGVALIVRAERFGGARA
jgi:hypothetical protein